MKEKNFAKWGKRISPNGGGKNFVKCGKRISSNGGKEFRQMGEKNFAKWWKSIQNFIFTVYNVINMNI